MHGLKTMFAILTEELQQASLSWKPRSIEALRTGGARNDRLGTWSGIEVHMFDSVAPLGVLIDSTALAATRRPWIIAPLLHGRTGLSEPAFSKIAVFPSGFVGVVSVRRRSVPSAMVRVLGLSAMPRPMTFVPLIESS